MKYGGLFFSGGPAPPADGRGGGPAGVQPGDGTGGSDPVRGRDHPPVGAARRRPAGHRPGGIWGGNPPHSYIVVLSKIKLLKHSLKKKVLCNFPEWHSISITCN